MPSISHNSRRCSRFAWQIRTKLNRYGQIEALPACNNARHTCTNRFMWLTKLFCCSTKTSVALTSSSRFANACADLLSCWCFCSLAYTFFSSYSQSWALLLLLCTAAAASLRRIFSEYIRAGTTGRAVEAKRSDGTLICGGSRESHVTVELSTWNAWTKLIVFCFVLSVGHFSLSRRRLVQCWPACTMFVASFTSHGDLWLRSMRDIPELCRRFYWPPTNCSSFACRTMNEN